VKAAPRFNAALLGVASAFVAAALVSRLLLARAPTRFAPDLAQPLPVVTNWYGYGAILLAVLAAAVLAATFAYLKIAHAAARGEVGIVLVVTGTALALAAAWLVPVLYSSDVYAYALYGELARLGADPYGHAMLPHGNAIFDAAIWQWSNPPPPCVYGPLFVAIARETIGALHGLGIVAQLDGLRLVASAALFACTALAYAAFEGTPAQRAAAAATIGLNPAAVWCAAEGHNDALALAIVLGGFASVRAGWFGAGGLHAASSALVKAPGIAAAAVLAVVSSRARAGALAGIVVAVVLCFPLLRALAVHVAPTGSYAPHASVQAIFGAIPWLAWSVAAVVCAWFGYRGVMKLRDARPEGWCCLALAAYVLIPNPYPWYGLWLLPVAALAPRTPTAIALVVLSLTSMLRYVPDAVGAPNELGAVLLGIVAALPYAVTLKRLT